MTGDLGMVTSNLETATVASHDAVSRAESSQNRFCHIMVGNPEIDSLGGESLVEYCKADGVFQSKPIQFYEDLSLFVLTFILRILNQLALEEARGLKPHLETYVAWMNITIAKFHRETYHIQSQSGRACPEKLLIFIDALIDRISNITRAGILFAAIEQNLLDMIYGKVYPLKLFLRGS
jgi:hypothetical protein